MDIKDAATALAGEFDPASVREVESALNSPAVPDILGQNLASDAVLGTSDNPETEANEQSQVMHQGLREMLRAGGGTVHLAYDDNAAGGQDPRWYSVSEEGFIFKKFVISESPSGFVPSDVEKRRWQEAQANYTGTAATGSGAGSTLTSPAPPSGVIAREIPPAPSVNARPVGEATGKTQAAAKPAWVAANEAEIAATLPVGGQKHEFDNDAKLSTPNVPVIGGQPGQFAFDEKSTPDQKMAAVRTSAFNAAVKQGASPEAAAVYVRQLEEGSGETPSADTMLARLNSDLSTTVPGSNNNVFLPYKNPKDYAFSRYGGNTDEDRKTFDTAWNSAGVKNNRSGWAQAMGENFEIMGQDYLDQVAVGGGDSWHLENDDWSRLGGDKIYGPENKAEMLGLVNDWMDEQYAQVLGPFQVDGDLLGLPEDHAGTQNLTTDDYIARLGEQRAKLEGMNGTPEGLQAAKDIEKIDKEIQRMEERKQDIVKKGEDGLRNPGLLEKMVGKEKYQALDKEVKESNTLRKDEMFSQLATLAQGAEALTEQTGKLLSPVTAALKGVATVADDGKKLYGAVTTFFDGRVEKLKDFMDTALTTQKELLTKITDRSTPKELVTANEAYSYGSAAASQAEGRLDTSGTKPEAGGMFAKANANQDATGGQPRDIRENEERIKRLQQRKQMDRMV